MVSELPIIWKQTVQEGSTELEWVPVLLDFGLTKRLPIKARRGLCKWVSAVEAMDGERMKVAFEEIGAWQDTHTCMCSATVNTNARIENVGKYNSCMVSKLRIIWKRTRTSRCIWRADDLDWNCFQSEVGWFLWFCL